MKTMVTDCWKWIFMLASQYWISIFKFLGLEMVCEVIVVVLSVLIKLILDFVMSSSSFTVFVVVFIGLQVVLVFMHTYAGRVHLDVHHTILNDLQKSVFLSSSYSGHVVTCLEKDVSIVTDAVLNVVSKIILACFQFILSVLILFYYNFILGFVSLVSVPLFVWIYFVRVHKLLEFQKSCMKLQDEKMDVFIDGLDVSVLSLLQEKDHHVCMSQYDFQSRSAIVLYLLGLFVKYVCFGVAIVSFESVGSLILYVTLIHRVFVSFSKVIEFVPDVIKASVSAFRLHLCK